uniref:hypothetical protein n=1 Tax=Providencia stuartii TaxID=588 RepID=UPI0034D54F52
KKNALIIRGHLAIKKQYFGVYAACGAACGLYDALFSLLTRKKALLPKTFFSISLQLGEIYIYLSYIDIKDFLFLYRSRYIYIIPNF